MALKRPPQHRADAPPLFIYQGDDAWDWERINRERDELEKSGAKGGHPVDHYLGGATRYDIDAPATIGGATVSARSYLREGAKPTVFELRRVSGLERTKAAVAFGDSQARQDALWRLAKIGLVKVTEGFDGEPWDLEGGVVPMTDHDLQQLYEVDPLLVQAVGFAVFHTSAPLSEAEGKR